MSKVSIILVTFNGLTETTAPCLDSLFMRTSYPDYEVVVVDNGSTDGTKEYLEELARSEPRLRCVLNETNRGFAGGNNDGIQVASGDMLVLLNNDTQVTEGWLDRLTQALAEDDSIGLVGPVSNAVGNEQLIFAPGNEPLEIIEEGVRWTGKSEGDTFETERLGFFCVALRRDVLGRIGLLDEAFGLGFYEDDDFCLRARKAGYRLVCREDVFVYHRGSATFGKVSKTARQLLKRNRWLLEAKHGCTYHPRHPRDRQLDLVESYLQRLEESGFDEGLLFRTEKRLQLAYGMKPRGIWKKICFNRRVTSLTRRIERVAGKESV